MSSESGATFIGQAMPAFIAEATEQLESMEQVMLQLEDTPRDRELLDALFRSAHTIKGSAGIFGLDPIVAFTHHVETLLDQLREGKRDFDSDIGTLLLRCADEIRALLAAVTNPGADSSDPAGREALIAALKAASGREEPSAPVMAPPATASAAGGVPADWHVEVDFGPDTLRNGMDPGAILNYLRELGTIDELVCHTDDIPDIELIDPEQCYLHYTFDVHAGCPLARIESAFDFVREDSAISIKPHSAGIASPEVAPAATPAAPMPPAATTRAAEPGSGRSGGKPKAGEDARYIRVQADRLDHVINLLGELVIASASASLLARQSHQGTLIEANQQISSLVEDIRNGTLQLRMVPIGDTFARFRRVVRDTAAELGKDIAFEVLGGETELDKAVVERIVDPLMHLVRNALDHGLEPPDQREQAGKPRQGTLTLAACHESGSIVIRILDDGRGIDRAKVLQRARERGLVAPDATPSDADIVNLIFQPGFSTAEKVTNLSGRGVGMDVVRSNIEALRGTVAVSSEAGRGSCIEIRLPLTLAIIDGFLVGVGNARFIFPLDSVIEVIEDRAAKKSFDANGRTVADLRGQLLPIIDVRTLYELESPPPARASVIVVQWGASRLGVQVDTLLGHHQTVIKPLGRLFQGLRGISGSTILGNGEVALIFDVAALGDLACSIQFDNRTTVRELT